MPPPIQILHASLAPQLVHAAYGAQPGPPMNCTDTTTVSRSHSRSPKQRPVHMLSVQLLQTYKKINEKFYEKKRKDTGGKNFNDGFDDEQGNYVIHPGEEIAGRYIVQDVLGKGSFGVVVRAHDHKREEHVAIKIIKNKPQFYQQAKVEIDILTKLGAMATDEGNMVKLKKVFEWKDHVCLVFEMLSFNLYDLLKYTKFQGVSLFLVKKFAIQILRTLVFLGNCQVIHCDLKPENVLLRNPKHSAIKVIDFGSSCYVSKRMYKYIQSRFYRAPEVILGHPYDCAIDMWSLACMLVEMHTGQPLFDGKDEPEQLCKFQAIMGALPTKMVETSPKRANFYQYDAKTKRYILAPPNKDVNRYRPAALKDVINTGRRKDQPGHSAEDYVQFTDFIEQMLKYDPKMRVLPAEALKHPFIAPAAAAPTDAAPATVESAIASSVSPRRSRCNSAVSGGYRSTSRDATRAMSRDPAPRGEAAVGSAATRSLSRDQPRSARLSSSHTNTYYR